MSESTTYTTKQAAEELGCCQSTVQAICAERDIGRLIFGRYRELSPKDLKAIERIRSERKPGRPPKTLQK